MSNRVRLSRIFHGWMAGGLDPAEWESLPESERVASQLRFIARRGSALGNATWDESLGLPANIQRTAMNAAYKATAALAALESDETPSATAVFHALQCGMMVEKVMAEQAIHKALNLTIELDTAAPSIQRGEKLIASASLGGKKKAENGWKHRAHELQAAVQEEQAKNPRRKKHEINQIVARKKHCSVSSVNRYGWAETAD